ncbi:MAG: GTPase HflX [Candidatus Omnitrophota bacterium]
MRERALLVTVGFDSLRRESILEDTARELEELSRSAGLFVAQSLVFRQKRPNAPFLLGSGRAAELRGLVEKERADVVVFGSNLSTSQQRNLEDIVGTKTIDRTQLILDIFALRARSAEGRVQVELAQLKYLLPRLAGKGIYLSRLGGGVGTRGPGEQKLEVDRRRIRERIARLGRELLALDKRRLAGIQAKKEKDLPLIALVGYTNAGKSRLFNALTRSAVVVQDRLFSTLDTTTRLIELPGNQSALLADTVGFVRELPHGLVESFKATLEEAIHADVLLHVMDASRSDAPFMEKAVRNVLDELGVGEKETLLVQNKADLLKGEERGKAAEDAVKKGGVLVSALTGEGLDRLLARISDSLGRGRLEMEFFVPKERLGLAGFLYREGEIIDRKDLPSGSKFIVRLPYKAGEIFKNKLKNAKKRA